MERKIWIIFGIFFGLCGVASILVSSWLFIHRWSARNWPTVTGTVSDARVDSYTVTGKSGTSRARYVPRVFYKYTVDNKSYSSDVVDRFTYSSSNERDAQKKIAEYSDGKDIKVYYNPSNPSESMLKPGVQFFFFIFIFVGLIFVGLGYLFIRMAPPGS